MRLLLAFLVILAFVVFVGPELAHAQGAGERVGENVGDLLGGWAKQLYVGLAAVVALVFLLNRKFVELAIYMATAVLVGGFVLAPDAVAGLVKDIWKTVTL
jgi:hypothetical protein